MGATVLTPDERQRAWRLAYLDSLERHADLEIGWERDQWRKLGAEGIAGLCDELLAERRVDSFSLPAETTARDLDGLWRRVARDEAVALVQSGAVCLVAAMRLIYWLRATPQELAA